MEDITFLIVDNETESQQNMVNALSYLKYNTIYTANHGNEAWSILNMGKKVGCIISVWDMPNMTGIALLRIVRGSDHFSDLPFFLVTDKITRAQVIEAGEAGTTGIMLKPFTMDSFKKKIDSIKQLRHEFANLESKKHLEKAKLYLDNKDWDKALAEFKQVLEYTENAEVYYNVGYIKTSQGNYEEALIAFRKATQINNAFAKAYRGMGEAYKKLGRKTEAEENLQKAAEIYMNKQMDENAEQVLNEILQINPNTVNVFNSLGILYRKQGRFQDALTQYQRAQKVDPNEEKILYNIGRCYLEMKNLEEAKKAFAKALELNPNFEEANQMLKAIEIGVF
ncbi:MAG: tetratricopeptide repeat protein [Pseudomonadota bacterium]